jgi:hypothetical protein
MYVPDAAVSAVVTNCLFTTLAFLSVCLRAATRLFMISNVGSDDYLIILAMVSWSPSPQRLPQPMCALHGVQLCPASS